MVASFLFWGGYWWDDPPPGERYFLSVLLDGHYLEHPYIVPAVRKAITKLILWARKTVRRITPPERSYRGGRRK